MRMLCRYTLPLSELGGDFYDELKSVSSGYASFDYEEAEYRFASACACMRMMVSLCILPRSKLTVCMSP